MVMDEDWEVERIKRGRRRRKKGSQSRSFFLGVGDFFGPSRFCG